MTTADPPRAGSAADFDTPDPWHAGSAADFDEPDPAYVRRVATIDDSSELSRVRDPLQCQIERTGSEQRQNRERPRAGFVDGEKRRGLAGLQIELLPFAHQRVMRAQFVRAGRDVARDAVAALQNSDLLAIQRHEYFAESDVLLRGTHDDHSGCLVGGRGSGFVGHRL